MKGTTGRCPRDCEADGGCCGFSTADSRSFTTSFGDSGDHKDNFSKGPVLFRQIRLGFNGKRFALFKFRTMVVDAEKLLRDSPVLYEEYLANNFKLPKIVTPCDQVRAVSKGNQLRRNTSAN